MITENGWPSCSSDGCQWITVPGTNPPVSLQLQNGQPAVILRAWAADWNAYIEPLRDNDSAGWTPTNSVATSNHLGGTAIDLNWNSHPFHSTTSMTAAQLAVLDDLIDFYEKTVFWAGNWDDPVDQMHSQMGYGTYGNPHTADFIARKIRPDGYSAFRRSSAPAADHLDLLAKAMEPTNVSRERLATLLPGIAQSWELCNANTIERRAMWCAQVGTESGGLRWQEEIADGSAYNGRTDLGNTQPDDGPRFKGRDFIQITGRSNYSNLSAWAYSRGLVPTPTFFVDNPTDLATDQYAFLGVTWYWTIARNMNYYADTRDILGATKAVNGGTNGLSDRTARWNNCLALGDQLMTITTDPADPILELLMSDLQLESLSIYATPGEPLIPIARMIQSIDGMAHRELIETAAQLGDPDALARIARTAAGKGKYTDPATINHAKAILANIEATNPAALQAFLKGA